MRIAFRPKPPLSESISHVVAVVADILSLETTSTEIKSSSFVLHAQGPPKPSGQPIFYSKQPPKHAKPNTTPTPPVPPPPSPKVVSSEAPVHTPNRLPPNHPAPPHPSVHNHDPALRPHQGASPSPVHHNQSSARPSTSSDRNIFSLPGSL